MEIFKYFLYTYLDLHAITKIQKQVKLVKKKKELNKNLITYDHSVLENITRNLKQDSNVNKNVFFKISLVNVFYQDKS